MAQGRSTIIISMIKRIRTSRLFIKNSLSALGTGGLVNLEDVGERPAIHEFHDDPEAAVEHECLAVFHHCRVRLYEVQRSEPFFKGEPSEPTIQPAG